MKYTRLVAAALLLAAACQEKESLIPETQHVQLFFGDELSDTKADVDGLSGLTTWGTGDQVAIFIGGPGANAYQTKTVTGGMIPVSLTSGQSRTNYAIYPATAAVSGHHTAGDLQVNYPASYDLSALSDDAKATYSPLPMVAVNNTTGALVFYNVGAVLRLTVNSIPAATRYLRFTVPGKNIAGNYTVTAPSTATPTVALADGASSSVTFQLAAETIGTIKDLTLNLPVPAGDYSAVNYVAIEALGTDGSTVLATTRANATRWTTLFRRKGRKQTSSFAPADFVITSAEATLWKGGNTTTYTTNYPGAVWSVVSGGDKISVNATTGEITATAAGVASVKATLNGLVDTPAVNVYVNAVTGISVTPDAYNVAIGNTITLTATLTNTNHGTINSYPSNLVNWTSSNTSYVTVASASVTPVPVDATTMTTTVTVNGVAAGSAYLTATVAAAYADTAPLSDANNTVTCRIPATITFPSDGEKYKFRGLYLHPGVLFWNGTTFSVTDGTDPLVLLQHYWYDSQTTKFDGSPGAEWVNCCYFTWTQLKQRLDGSVENTDIAATMSAALPGSATTAGWRIPSASATLDKNTDFGKIIADTPAHSIKINSRDATTDNTSNYVRVNVDLAGSTYAGKGLGYSTDIGDKAGDLNYQSGLLLIPDGAVVTCVGIQTSDYGSWNGTTASSSVNVISYDDLCTLVSGGCVFLPTAGDYYESSWRTGGRNGNSWSSTPYSSLACNLYFNHVNVSTGGADTSLYFPVHLVR